MAGKRCSRRHSTSSFSENVEVAKTSYQMLEVLRYQFAIVRGCIKPPSRKVRVITLQVKKGKMNDFPGSLYFDYAKKLQVKSGTRSRPCP